MDKYWDKEQLEQLSREELCAIILEEKTPTNNLAYLASMFLKITGMILWEYHKTPEENFFLLYRDIKKPIKVSYQTWQNSIHPEDLDKMMDKLDRVTPHEEQCRVMNKKGSYQWVLVKGKSIIKTPDMTKMVGISIDIHRQKKIEEILLKSEEKFRKLIEQNPSCIAIYTHKKFLYVNPEFLKLTGYSKSEMARLHPLQLIHYDNYPEAKERFEKRAHDSENVETRYDLQLVSSDGQSIWVDFHVGQIYYQGQKAFIASIYDISQRKFMEQELKSSNEQLKAVEEELRQNAEELYSINENLEYTKLQLERLLESEQLTNKKIEKKNKQLYTQRQEGKKMLRELKKAQTQLVQSEKMASLGMLVAGVAHEINNPINYINSSSEGLKIILNDIITLLQQYDQLTLDNFQKKYAEINQTKENIEYQEIITDAADLIENIHSGAEQVATIVRSLRNFTRQEEDSLKWVDVHQLLDTTLVILHNQYKKFLHIEKEYANNLPNIECYPNKLSQVFMNLLMNAIQAIQIRQNQDKEHEGIIYIKTYYLNETSLQLVAIEIEDNGMGVPEKLGKKVFEPFVTSKDVGEGTGLGLSICMSIIDNHKGTIDFQNLPNQKGVKFKIYLPIKQK
ncbi:MAG: PAS domain S-box protein [Cytophagales bacterium]|nr:MAG: PAS domain S-box protein [Cytophagales bacterium]